LILAFTILFATNARAQIGSQDLKRGAGPVSKAGSDANSTRLRQNQSFRADNKRDKVLHRQEYRGIPLSVTVDPQPEARPSRSRRGKGRLIIQPHAAATVHGEFAPPDLESSFSADIRVHSDATAGDQLAKVN